MKAFILALLLVVVLHPLKAQNVLWEKVVDTYPSRVKCTRIAPDGKNVVAIASCFYANIVRLYDTYYGNVIWQDTLPGISTCAQAAIFSKDTSKMLIADGSGNVYIYNYINGNPVLVRTVNTGTFSALAVAASPDNTKMAVTCSNGKLLIYNINTGHLLHSINAFPVALTGVDWSINNQIVTCADDYFLKLWDTTGALLNTLYGHTANVTCVRFTHDGKKILSGSQDNTVKIWDIGTGNVLKTLAHSGTVMDVDGSDDGTRLASVCADGYIRIWNLNTGKLYTGFQSFTNNNAPINSVDYLDGSIDYLVAGTDPGFIQYWVLKWPSNINNLQEQNTVQIYPNPCNDVLMLINSAIDFHITDLLGKEYHVPFKTDANGHTIIYTSSLAIGEYFLKINDGKNFSFTKFTKGF